MKFYRYPGVRPFEAADRTLFFGRDRDIADLFEMIRAERLVVLFGKSGYGKSSLLNAGVLPRLKGLMTPLEVRLGEYIAGQSLTPVETIRRKTPVPHKLKSDAAYLADLPSTLWTHFKQLDAGEKGSYLLVFDQFEEFFSYPADQQRAFRDQLADLLNGELPEDLREAARALDRDQRRLLSAPMDIRVLFSIRSDRMHELDRLKDRLPAILHKRYELKALSRDQAREAIIGPAALIDPRPDIHEDHVVNIQMKDQWVFASPPFEYGEDALTKILAGLAISNTSQQTGVEAFQLQILCDSIESGLAAGLMSTKSTITASDLPDFTEVFAQYYERRLTHLPEIQRAAARRVIEDGLVRYDTATDEGRRLSVDGQTLIKDLEAIDLSAGLLRDLENTFLVRREPNTLGGYNYELSHDTLLPPVVRAKKKRLAEEEEEKEKEQLAEEKARIARERADAQRRQRQTLLTSFIAGILVLAAVVASIFALEESRKALEATELANQIRREAEVNKLIAKTKTEEAEQKTNAANLAEVRANRSEEIAALEQTKARTEQQNARLMQLKAEKAAEQAVVALIDAARKDILHLRYDAALLKMMNAEGLGSMKDSVAFVLMEIGYFQYHIGQSDQALKPLALAAKLLGKPGVLMVNNFDFGLESLYLPLVGMLKKRYFPEMVDIQGGVFSMGSDNPEDSDSYIEKGKPRGAVNMDSDTPEDSYFGNARPSHDVNVSNFKIARTETTVWQYNLYLASKGQNINDKKIIPRPGWGWEGDNPVVNVSWYDALQYAIWLIVLCHFNKNAYALFVLEKIMDHLPLKKRCFGILRPLW
jgi:formylglycine-generating enzyme required for sulfatase activity/energy-coupling factor transporter ATP-binding protein EcfA2